MANIATTIMILVEFMVKTPSIVFWRGLVVVWVSYFQLRSTYVLDFFVMDDYEGISTIKNSTRSDLIRLKRIKFFSPFFLS